MAADNTAIAAASLTLVAGTSMTIELTGPGKRIQLINQSATAADIVYFKIATTEALADTLLGAGADEERVLRPGERLVINVARVRGANIWIGLRSAGTPVVSAELWPGGN